MIALRTLKASQDVVEYAIRNSSWRGKKRHCTQMAEAEDEQHMCIE